jgi:hypothetical protein
LGTSIAALFGIVFAYSRQSIPGSSNKKKALILAGIMWIVIFLVPVLKYPANPPVVGDPETIYYRRSLYIVYLVISGFTALSVGLMYRKMRAIQSKKVMIVPAVYAIVMVSLISGITTKP